MSDNLPRDEGFASPLRVWIDAHDAAVAERDALARRMDAVRAQCDLWIREVASPDGHDLSFPSRTIDSLARRIMALLDGDGKAA